MIVQLVDVTQLFLVSLPKADNTLLNVCTRKVKCVAEVLLFHVDQMKDLFRWLREVVSSAAKDAIFLYPLL